MTEQNTPRATEMQFESDEEISLIPLQRFFSFGVEEKICELSCKLSKFAHDFPKYYNDFLASNEHMFPDTEDNIFSLHADFPQSSEVNEADAVFETELLIVEVEDQIIHDGIDYGNEAIVGMSVNAPNGTSFVFYINQLRALEDYVMELDSLGKLGTGEPEVSLDT